MAATSKSTIKSEKNKKIKTPAISQIRLIQPRPDVLEEPFIDEKNKFFLNKKTVKYLYKLKPQFGFNGFGATVYYRTYSRKITDAKGNEKNEHWHDTVIRVTNGIMTIRKDYHIKNRLEWNEKKWQKFASNYAISMFQMQHLPPGRGLWAMGTEFIYKRGSTALYNCAFTSTETDLVGAAEWTMDLLMNGCGVGFDVLWNGKNVKIPDYILNGPTENNSNYYNHYTFVIPDSREGWCDSLMALMNAFVANIDGTYNNFPIFDYSLIRPMGEPIRGFGGIASGPEPLEKLHKRVQEYLTNFCYNKISATRCVADIFNSIGACVVAGNVRRSAELALGNVDDEEFINLKNYELYPERGEIGWMSNNSIILRKTEDFEKIPTLIDGIKKNGEPGLINLLNIQKFARFGKEKHDCACGMNPCGEICLESKETCNLSETFPSRCTNDSIKYHLIGNNYNVFPEFNKEVFNEEILYDAMRFATFYSSTVALLPTHRPETNKIIARNRRIGVSISGVADWLDEMGSTDITRICRKSYRIIEEYNKHLADEAGVPPSIRLTTIKPSGSISQLVGVSSGMHFPTFKYAIRRIRASMNSPIATTLIKSNIPYEVDFYSDNTYVFEFPVYLGKTRKSTDVSMWEQFALAAMLQREYSDNSVSVTIYYNPKTESHDIEKALSMFIPILKSISILPHSEQGAYVQMPYEGISEEEYEARLAKLPKIDWNVFCGSDGQLVKYCTNDSCDLIKIDDETFSKSPNFSEKNDF